jgi:biofilm PGA synthesis N-glycosyltransferase PgaC
MEAIVGVLLIAIPLAYYALYTLIVKTLAKAKSPQSPTTQTFTPFISIIIPTYNEKKMIEKRVRNFDEIAYPSGQFEVIFVDGASNDGTPDLIERLKTENRPYIRLVKQPSRQGYNSAIYEGISQAKSTIVVTGEVGAIFHKDAIRLAVRHLADPSIGAATGKSVLYNPDESFATRLEAAYRSAHDQLRYAESIIDTTSDMKGELLAFRREIGLALQPGKVLSEKGSFDMCLSYMARLSGLRAIFDPEAIFYEYAPVSLRERIMVQTRRGASFTGALLSFRSMIFNRKYGRFGMLIAPSRLLMLIVLPWMMIAAPFVLLLESLFNPIPAAILLAMAGVTLLVKKTRYTLVSFILSQIVLSIASLRLLTGRHSQIINTASTTRR